MKVKKLGKIFEARPPYLPHGCISHAQSPQVLCLDDGVRIYFSTRTRDGSGMFLSHVGFVEMDGEFGAIRRTSASPVVDLGKRGNFDEHGIFPMNVLRVGKEVWGYTTGWNRRVSVSVDTGIGRVISNDNGLTFKRCGEGPVLGPSLHEPFLVGDGFVMMEDGRFTMWYMFGTCWVRPEPDSPPDRVYKIGRAISADGINWKPGNGRAIIEDRLGPNECQALPSVLYHKGAYHMVFCFRDIHGFRDDPTKAYRIGYATSDDGLNWERKDSELDLSDAGDDWDKDMQCYPHLCEVNGNVYLLYNGNGFGRDGFGLAHLEL